MNKFLKIYLGVALVILLSGIIVAGYIFISRPSVSSLIVSQVVSQNVGASNSEEILANIPEPVTPEPPERLPRETALVFGGDVMLSRVVGQKMVKYKDYNWPFAKVADIFSSADIASVNLESPFKKSGNHVVLTGSFAFDADPRAMGGLQTAGIDLVTLANNHFGNQGQVGMIDTFSLLDDNHIEYIGAGTTTASAHQGKIIEVHGVKFGFLGYAYPDDLYNATGKLAGIANMDILTAKRDVTELKKQVDVVIVQMHAGVEYVTTPNKQQKDFAHAVVDAGADIVIGHHPHWVQVTEIYQGKPILYSLGNLVFDQMWSRETQQGAVAKVIFNNQKLQSIKIIPIHINDYGQPSIVGDAKEQKEILKRMGLAVDMIYLAPR